MPKKHPKPFWREQTQCYYVQIGKKQYRLATDEDEAWRRYHELMATPPEQQKPLPTGPSTTVLELLDAFLEWTRINQAERTFHWHRDHIQTFVSAIPPALSVAELKPYHVTRVMDAHDTWSNSTKNGFARSVQRALNWAEGQGMIDRSPIRRLEKPAMEVREMAVTPAEYAAVRAAITEPCFRDLVDLSWETGARVQELRKIEARFVDLATSRIVFPPLESKGKRYHRVIYLTPRACEILARLAAQHRSGPLLRNSAGSPWTKDSINCALSRLQLRMGLQAVREKGLAPKMPAQPKTLALAPEQRARTKEKYRAAVAKHREKMVQLARIHAPKYYLGAFRKGYATEALKAGIDTVTVSHLLGHRDPTMVSKVYGHVQQDPEHMADAVQRAKRLGQPKTLEPPK